MNSELNKVFGRDFLIGFFLPALFFLAGTLGLAHLPGVENHWFDWVKIDLEKPLEDSALLTLIVWVFAVFLQALNREIFRLAEGYWGDWLRWRMAWFQRWRFSKLERDLQTLEGEREACANEKKPFNKNEALMKIWRLRVTRYPNEELTVLPTTFGNIVRAYEDYPRVLYGFESINGWSRLQALFSKEFRENLSQARARVDLWLNTCFLATVLAAETAAVLHHFHLAGLIWIIPCLLLLALCAYARAKRGAEQYGEQVKAAFDIYLPKLAKKLGYDLSSDIEKNFRFWDFFSKMIVYRSKEAFEDMTGCGLNRIADKEGDSNEQSESDDGSADE